MYSVYLTESKFVSKQLIPLTTTYLYEAEFGAMAVLKSKHQNRLDVEHTSPDIFQTHLVYVVMPKPSHTKISNTY